nr:uncharacterized protein LOC124817990 [Hydra vulgaris]
MKNVKFASQKVVLLMTLTIINGMPIQNMIKQINFKHDTNIRHDVIFLPQVMPEEEKQKIENLFENIYLHINSSDLKECIFKSQLNKDGTYEVVLNLNGYVDYLLLRNIDIRRLKMNKSCCDKISSTTYYVVLKNLELIGEPCKWKKC